MKKAFIIFCSSIFLASVSLVFAGQLPSYKRLCKELKDLPGWQAEKCEGMNVSGGPMGEIVSADRSYTKENKLIKATIICGIQAMGYWAPFATHIQLDSNEEFMKVTDIKGYDVGIDYHKQDKSGGIVVNLTKGEEVTAVLVLDFENMSWREALKIARKFNWNEMEGLISK